MSQARSFISQSHASLRAKYLLIPLAAALGSLAGGPVQAADPAVKPVPRDGKVVETTNLPFAMVQVWRTDKNGKDAGIPGGGLIGSPARTIPNPTGSGTITLTPSATFTFPADPRWPDVHQRITQIPLPKGRSSSEGLTAAAEAPAELASNDLMIESIFLNPDTSKYELLDVFGTIDQMLGSGATVRIPDLFADTNGDGTIGAGDLVYSLVDLRQYLESPPSFSLSDHFSIVNGTVAELPGMWFSATPFTFSPDSGFTTSGLLSADALGPTSLTADGVVDAIHTLSSSPEPATWALMLGGFGALGFTMRRQRAAVSFR